MGTFAGFQQASHKTTALFEGDQSERIMQREFEEFGGEDQNGLP